MTFDCGFKFSYCNTLFSSSVCILDRWPGIYYHTAGILLALIVINEQNDQFGKPQMVVIIRTC